MKRITVNGIGKKIEFTFSALNSSVVNFMLAAADDRLSWAETSPAFIERCS